MGEDTNKKGFFFVFVFVLFVFCFFMCVIIAVIDIKLDPFLSSKISCLYHLYLLRAVRVNEWHGMYDVLMWTASQCVIQYDAV